MEKLAVGLGVLFILLLGFQGYKAIEDSNNTNKTKNNIIEVKIEPEKNQEEACGTDCINDNSASEDYKTFINNSEVFTPVTMENAWEIIENKESGLFYFGFAKCPWCQEAVKVLKEALENNQKDIYYVNIRPLGDEKEDDIRVDENETYIKFKNYLQKYAMDETKKIYVPVVFKVEKGELTSVHYATLDKHDAKKRKMTEEEKVELYNIYNTMIQTKKEAK